MIARYKNGHTQCLLLMKIFFTKFQKDVLMTIEES